MVPALCLESGFAVLGNYLPQRRQDIMFHPSSLYPSLLSSWCSQQVFRRGLLSQDIILGPPSFAGFRLGFFLLSFPSVDTQKSDTPTEEGPAVLQMMSALIYYCLISCCLLLPLHGVSSVRERLLFFGQDRWSEN